MGPDELERFTTLRRKASPSPISLDAPSFRCLACGGPIAQCLGECGSLRCHDCRAGREPLRADLAALTRAAAGAVHPPTDPLLSEPL
jgi:hypothetical protein